jgi:hypothetical protein
VFRRVSIDHERQEQPIMGITASYHIRRDENVKIKIETQHTNGIGEYPVLDIGDVTYWPSIFHLKKIRDTIDRWLQSPDGVRLAKAEEPETPDGWERLGKILFGPNGIMIDQTTGQHLLYHHRVGRQDYSSEREALEAARVILDAEASTGKALPCLEATDGASPMMLTV